MKNEDELKEKMKLEIVFEKVIKVIVIDKDVKNNYKLEMKVSYILVKDEKMVKEIKEKVNNGEDFVVLVN